MKEVFVVHGGNVYTTYEKYLERLTTKPVDLSDGQHYDWKRSLMRELGHDYNVTQPRFPNKDNAKYNEWKIVFEKYIKLIPEQSILIGHSLGGCFLSKYLSETSYPKQIRATILVAAPFDSEDDDGLVEITPTGSLSLFKKQGGSIHLFHSEDDAVVSFSELVKYKAALPEAVPHVFHDRGHFNQEDFPELVELIKSL